MHECEGNNLDKAKQQAAGCSFGPASLLEFGISQLA